MPQLFQRRQNKWAEIDHLYIVAVEGDETLDQQDKMELLRAITPARPFARAKIRNRMLDHLQRGKSIDPETGALSANIDMSSLLKEIWKILIPLFLDWIMNFFDDDE